jgi:hypothetical protein
MEHLIGKLPSIPTLPKNGKGCFGFLSSLGVKEKVFFDLLRASPVVLYYKPESGKRWKDMNCCSGQQGRSMYSSFIYKLKPDFGRFFRGACNRFWNVLFWKDSQVWENDVLMITGLQAYKMTGDALRQYQY